MTTRRWVRAAALALVLAGLQPVSSARADGPAGSWTDLGGAINATTTPHADSTTHELASVADSPWVAFLEPAPTTAVPQLHVSRWDGTAWVPVGGALNVDPTRAADAPSITDVGGTAYVAWSEAEASGSGIRVARWTGTAWQAVGGPLDLGGAGNGGLDPTIRAIGGAPYVGFTNLASAAAPDDETLEVEGWTGSAWVRVGGSVATGLTVQDGISITGTSQPYAAWSTPESVGGGVVRPRLHVARFTGSAWVADLGVPTHAGALAGTYPSMAMLGGTPALAWQEVDAGGANRLWVAAYRSAGWVDLGPSVADDDVEKTDAEFLDGPSLAEVGGTPYVAWGQRVPVAGLHVASFDGTAWSAVGDPLLRNPGTPGSSTGQASLAAVAGKPVVSWREDRSFDADTGESSYAFYASRFDVPTPPPETTITNPETSVGGATATYSFTATPAAGATFACRLDGGPFAPCTSPYTSPILDPGYHRFAVQATTADGTDPTPAVVDFVVDRVAPTTTIGLVGDRLPAGYVGSVTVGAAGTDPSTNDAPGSGIRNTFCLVDPPAAPAPPNAVSQFGSTPCGQVVSAPGTHTAYAISNDRAGNESEIVSTTFRVLPFPDTVITSGPSGTVYAVPTFSFTGSPAGSTFRCALDQDGFRPCTSPITLVGAAQGAHVFAVVATSPDGATDPSPAARSFTLGTQTMTGLCRVLATYTRYQVNPTDQCALVAPFTCPRGSECVSRLTVAAKHEDRGSTLDGGANVESSETLSSVRRQGGLSCTADPYSNEFGRGEQCPERGSLSVLGTGQVLSPVCNAFGVLGIGFTQIAGPDAARYVTCAATITISPAVSLSTASSGGTVGIYVPGPGTIRIGPIGGGAPRAEARSGGKPKAAKATFTTQTATAAAAGPISFTLRLGKKLKAKLRKKGRVAVPVVATYVPADGTAPTSRTTVVTLTGKPHKPKKPKRR